jgi:hypothetical protein
LLDDDFVLTLKGDFNPRGLRFLLVELGTSMDNIPSTLVFRPSWVAKKIRH